MTREEAYEFADLADKVHDDLDELYEQRLTLKQALADDYLTKQDRKQCEMWLAKVVEKIDKQEQWLTRYDTMLDKHMDEYSPSTWNRIVSMVQKVLR
jgi:hypothetical protein